MLIFGTRPEAVKLAPIIKRLRGKGSKFKTIVCVTAQHREMLDQVLNFFKIKPDYDLDIMVNGQDLFDITTRSLKGLENILKKERPDIVLVQGDTTTSFVASLAAFYLKIPIGHVEAGLRTYNKYSPFPEEKNRCLTGTLADFHFAPTKWAKLNLLKENIPKDKIWVTGNTVIDALMSVVNSQKPAVRQRQLNEYFKERWDLIPSTNTNPNNSKLILVTGHRRESLGEGLKNICMALREIAERNPNITIVYPVHLNPNIRKTVYEIFGLNKTNQKNIFLIDPLDYEPFVYLMTKSYIILTDSGGIQEEAPSLGKPVLVMRNITERPEGIKAGTVKLVGTDKDRIISETQHLLDDRKAYEKMAKASNPYGDGKAAERIVNILEKVLMP